MDAILFLHHKSLETDPVTRRHFMLLRMFNENADVIPLAFGKTDKDYDWQWRNADLLVYEWFEKSDPKYERFFVIEYDTMCTMSLKDFYGPSYNKNAVGPTIIKPWSKEPMHQHCPEPAMIQRNWHWFADNESPEIWPFLRGIVPLSGCMFSHQALHGMVQVFKSVSGFDRLFCECRIATLAAMAGFEPVQIRTDAAEFLCADDVEFTSKKGIYHRVKN